MLSFSTEQHAIEGAIAFDNVDWIWASPRAAHDRAACRPADCDHAWRRQSLRRRRLRQRAALDGRDMSHRTPAAVALRLTGERPGTAAMPSARGFANGSSRHSAGSRQVAGQEKTSFRGRDRVAWAFSFAATARTLVRLSIAETGRWPRCSASPRTLSAAGASSRWRSQRLPRSRRGAASHLPGQVR